ncbi:Scr1 family TA system antitoxin-like transcriptional regulator [Streptomyces microflavus]|uniref:DUF397 domain-containing protein n=1 Tax=Streptomyces microflavus TaxID=1919 RepID=UPI003402BC21
MSVSWEAQLEHLIAIAELPMVTLQVLPLSAGAHHVMDGTLTLLWQEGYSGLVPVRDSKVPAGPAWAAFVEFAAGA